MVDIVKLCPFPLRGIVYRVMSPGGKIQKRRKWESKNKIGKL
jgi:hypothetical protein